MSNDQLKSRCVELVVLFAASLGMWWQPIANTIHIAFSSEAHTHILLVLPLSLALIWFELRETAPHLGRSWPGGVLLAAALLCRVMSQSSRLSATNSLSLSMFGLVMWWLGGVLACFGAEVFIALLFPLGFLILTVPFPGGMLTGITEFLRQSSARMTALLFQIAHVPVTRDGVLLSIPGLDLEIAQDCSSIRSSMALLLITLVLAHLFLHSWWRKILLVMAVIPLSVVKNAIRIFTIAELGTRVDPSFLDGRLHRNGGVLFLCLAVLLLVSILWLLRRGDSRTLQNRSLIAES